MLVEHIFAEILKLLTQSPKKSPKRDSLWQIFSLNYTSNQQIYINVQ